METTPRSDTRETLRHEIARTIHDGPNAVMELSTMGLAPHPWEACVHQDTYLADADALIAAGYGKAVVDDRLVAMVRDLTDPDDCWFDHAGGCQAHGYLSLEPGQMCPHAEAKQWLAALALNERETDRG